MGCTAIQYNAHNQPPGISHIEYSTTLKKDVCKSSMNLKPRKLNFLNERDRLSSYDEEHDQNINKEKAARYGFYYISADETLNCPFCGTKINLRTTSTDKFENLDDLHLSNNSSCPLMRRSTTDNIPIDQEKLNETLPAFFPDVCGSQEFPQIDKYPEMSRACYRRETFNDWPIQSIQDSEDLVEAGLFYFGKDDKVYCYSCGLGLENWEATDKPIEEHARHTNSCHFIKNLKGEDYIELIKFKYNNGNK